MKKLFTFIMTLGVLIGCSQASGPSKNDINEIIFNYAAVNHRLWEETALPIDKIEALNKDTEIVEKGIFNKHGNYYPFRLRVKGTRLRGVIEGKSEPFDEIIDAQITKDDYGKWRMHIEHSQSQLR